MATSPTLNAGRATLEPFDETKHLHERYVEWLNDPEIVRFSQQRHRSHSLESCRAYAAGFRTGPNYFWAIMAPDGGDEKPLRHVGTMTGYVTPSDGVADLGILLGERHLQGRGIATEAWTLACEFLLGQLDLRKVTAGTLSVNEPMLRLMRRVGMADDGRRVGQVLWEGQPVDIVYGALFRDAWHLRQRSFATLGAPQVP